MDVVKIVYEVYTVLMPKRFTEAYHQSLAVRLLPTLLGFPISAKYKATESML